MRISRRDFLCLSAMACTWLLTGCSSEVQERQVSWQAQESGISPGGAMPEQDGILLDDGRTLRAGIRIPDGFGLPTDALMSANCSPAKQLPQFLSWAVMYSIYAEAV